MTRSDLSFERLSWNASGIILGIGTLEVSLTLIANVTTRRKSSTIIHFVRQL